MTQWSWRPETFDVIVGILIQFAPPEEQARMFAGMVRALKPGGLLLLEGYGRKQIEYGTGGPRDVNRLYTRERLEAAFKDLASLDIQEYDTEMSEGTAHVGMSALVDLVGRK
jgi:hypothetical protein